MRRGRKSFLESLVSKLEDSGVSWCCLRNHHEFFEDSRSDVDLLVMPEDRSLFEAVLSEVAKDCGALLLQKADYLNRSLTYLTSAGEWVRIDYETEIRWGIFPVLSAREVLSRRVRTQKLWIASPMDESIVLWVAALFRNHLSERYRARLAELFADAKKNPLWKRILQQTFGGVGTLLPDWQALLTTPTRPAWNWLDLKLALWTQPLLHPSTAVAAWKYFFLDVQRLGRRLLHPPGLLIYLDSAGWQRSDSMELLWLLDPVFPMAKSLRIESPSNQGPLNRIRNRWRTFRSLFKGGAVLVHSSPSSSFFARFIKTLWLQTANPGQWVGANWENGRMQKISESSPANACFDLTTKLIANVSAVRKSTTTQFCVLLGLDGSGKTTLARTMATMAPSELGAFRYHHFLPRNRGVPEFPWPHHLPAPKKAARTKGLPDMVLSLLRLARNTLRAGWACWGWRGSLWEKGAVVVVDRYLYNYLLDPLSVSYSGPTSLARIALRWAPRPDLIFVLESPSRLLAERKDELSEREMEIQSRRLKEMPFVARKIVFLDASLTPEILATQCLKEIRGLNGYC